MSHHDLMIFKTMAGTMVCGLSLVLFAYGLGLIWRNWGW